MALCSPGGACQKRRRKKNTVVTDGTNQRRNISEIYKVRLYISLQTF